MSYDKRIIHINSRKRLSGTDADFTFKVDLRGLSKNATHCTVLQANIPKSFYMVQENYNTFELTEEAGNDTVTITIPPGNYNRLTLKTTVANLMTANSPNSHTYTISIPPSSGGDDGKYTYRCTGYTLESGITVSSDSNIFELLGFANGSSNSFVDGVLESSNVVKLSKEDSIVIHSDIVDEIEDDILQEIYTVDSSTFDNIVFQNQTPEHYEKRMRKNTSTVYRFYIMNEDNQPIDLNGLNWSLTLCCFVKDNTNALFKDYMKYNLSK